MELLIKSTFEGKNVITYEAYLKDVVIGTCQVNLYPNRYFGIFSLNIFEKYQRKGYATILMKEMERVAKHLDYKIIIGEWSQETETYDAPKKLLLSLGYRQMRKEDYSKTGFNKITEDRKDYIKEI